MVVLGIDTSCDDCAAALVKDGKTILSSVIASQNDAHAVFQGVVPEIASRLHTEQIVPVYRKALDDAGLTEADIDAIAVTARPGLVGSLLVGLSFAKALAFARRLPLWGVDHILAHLYAAQLEAEISYPFLGLLVSGGHTILAKVTAFDELEVLGTTVDDAVGEAFDKVAKFLGLGYPGGKAVDHLAQSGQSDAFHFPRPQLKPGRRPYDLSFSGLKTAVIHQRENFLRAGYDNSLPNVCASFQKTVVDMLLALVKKAVKETGISTVVLAGGVASNSSLRQEFSRVRTLTAFYPSLPLCTDNGAMVAGLGYHHLQRGDRSSWELNAESRVPHFKSFQKSRT
ncbi:MAG: tRNA (adenosine(37)-N6)-threonylcarbamoyltransferase complex transferase subunit TsaD [Spirochaetales bacterium]|nr:tRNA (adenosine(37)-N6)-threonylcarbamoyltransferase complex transferase subunit TsaD [Spirochaetales bacterium]